MRGALSGAYTVADSLAFVAVLFWIVTFSPSNVLGIFWSAQSICIGHERTNMRVDNFKVSITFSLNLCNLSAFEKAPQTIYNRASLTEDLPSGLSSVCRG